jgi:NADH pyrophosphatase NudC (nudix superfamily)
MGVISFARAPALHRAVRRRWPAASGAVTFIAMKYCPYCRQELEARLIDGRSRLACPASACTFVYWNNPVPVVAAVVEWNNQCVLARNAKWPPNVFSLITGFLDECEDPGSAAAREVREELALEVTSLEFLGHFPLPQLNQLVIAYAVRAEGQLATSEEIAEAKLVPLSELLGFDFGPLELTRAIVAEWLTRTPR